MVRFITVSKAETPARERLLDKMVKDARGMLFEEDSVCEVCGEQTENLVVYAPGEEENICGTPGGGKERVALMTICHWHMHYERRETETKVRKELVRQWQ